MNSKVYYGEYSLRHWIELLFNGNISLPKYQRSFVWSKNDVSAFVKTLNNQEFVPPITIGAFTDDDGNSHNYIIDGQQRLTSILLARIGYFPDITKFRNMNDLYSSDDESKDEDEKEPEYTMNWTFEKLLFDKKNSKDSVISKIQSEHSEEYKKFEENISDIIDKTFLGFCYIVPEKNSDQSKFYSSVFRHINNAGKKLLPQESRMSLYFLDKAKEKFFNNDIFDNCRINKSKKIDFVRYAAMASQYSLCKIFEQVMKNYSKKMNSITRISFIQA